jgi:23S rRNA (uracil1939-C5)-methyltransferase
MRVKIEKLVYGGEGLAHDSNATVFVPFVLPGEEVEFEVAERKKKFVRGRLQRVLVPSPERIQPNCPYFGVCGGCNYQYLPYDAQLRFKEGILRETLRRLGHLDWQQSITLHPSPPWAYRNRAQWKIRSLSENNAPLRELPANGAQLAIGYFRARTSSLCAVEACPILSPELEAALSSLREALAGGTLPEGLREIEAFADPESHKLLLNATCSSLGKVAKTLADELFARLPNAASILLQDATGQHLQLHGPGFLQYRALERQFRVGHLSFFQVNRFLLEELARAVAKAAGSGELAFDLYAGVGLFTLCLAETFSRVVAVEADPAAARDLEANAAAAGKQLVARNSTAEAFLAAWAMKERTSVPAAVVVDPPRAGLEPQALSQLISFAAPRIVYVSCDPATLARDLAQLCAKMYKVQEIHLFDMFPQTYHIETLVHLERAQ